MITVSNKTKLLTKTKRGFENEGAFNPAVFKEPDSDTVHIFYRAVREGNYSSIGYCKLDGPTTIVERDDKPLIFPERKYESQGVEDPRITKINDTFYLTYSAYDNVNVLGAYATSKDLKKFSKQGAITPRFTYREYKHFIECCNGLTDKYLFHYKIFKEHGLGPEVASKLLVWDKNLMFFPKKIDGKFALLHRIHPGIQIVYFQNFDELTREFWENYFMTLHTHIVMNPELHHESSHIGGGCPPIETEHGWLLIYHTGEATPHGFVYHASAALLDLKDPKRELSRLTYPLISPELPWEKVGVVNNIIFPSGTALFGNDLYIYYGAADESVGVASVKLDELVSELIKLKKK
jgi:beta-1,2-mannobiose phosphorylase / 1,2-beta-oligomannan phosphorylase